MENKTCWRFQKAPVLRGAPTCIPQPYGCRQRSLIFPRHFDVCKILILLRVALSWFSAASMLFSAASSIHNTSTHTLVSTSILFFQQDSISWAIRRHHWRRMCRYDPRPRCAKVSLDLQSRLRCLGAQFLAIICVLWIWICSRRQNTKMPSINMKNN